MVEIVKWLENKDYEAGVRLYNLHGSSALLKKIFSNGETGYSKQKLEEELEKLIPEVKQEINLEVDYSKKTIPVEVEPTRFEDKDISRHDNINYLKLTRRRDELNRQISRNMVLLDVSTSKVRRFETAKQIKNLYRLKTEAWAEIDYFLDNGSFKPIAVKEQPKTDELQRLYVQIYKAEKRLEKTELRNRGKTEKLLATKRARVEEIRKERKINE